MSVWSEIGQFLTRFAGDGFAALVERVRDAYQQNRAARNRVAFSIAIIALSAKMAKADGVVTEDEVSAFRDIFEVPAQEMDNVSRLYNLAKQDIAGYDTYAAQVRSLFPQENPDDRDVLHDVLDGLFHIAKADGVLHENEILFLEDISARFGFDEATFQRVRNRHAYGAGLNPYAVLGIERGTDIKTLRRHYHKRVAECHPDRLIARGVPPEFVRIASDRLATLNAAWEEIEADLATRDALEDAG